MEEFVKQALLYDFYGELLTDRQKQVYESVVIDDCSLSEAAEELGISRQGVHDMVRRCTNTLEEYEKKLGLVEKFLKIKEELLRIQSLAACAKSPDPGLEGCLKEIEGISGRILDEL